MTTRQTALPLILILLTVCVTGHVDAALVEYTDRPTWLTAVGPLSGTEDLNSFVSDASFQGTSVALNNMTVIGTTGFLGAISQKIDALPAELGGFYVMDGTPYLLGDITGSSEFIRFDFGNPVSAWGGDMIGIADVQRNTKIHVYDASNVLLGTVFTHSPSAETRSFYGFQLTSGLADHIIFTDNNTGDDDNDAFGIDNIGFVSIPEPSTFTLTCFGLLALGLYRRRAK